MRIPPSTLRISALACATFLLAPAKARSAEPTVEEEDLDITAGAARAAGPDERTRDLTLHANGGLLAPAGSLARGLGSGNRISAGPSIGGAVEVGISRYVGVGATVGYAFLSAPDECEGCGGSSFDAGVSLVYHVAQGIATDPWISLGVGYRSFSLEGPAEDYVGLDVAKIALGADFRPVRSFGFGPTLGLDLGTTLDRPPGREGSVHAMFVFGLRASFDPMDAFGGGPASAATGGAETSVRWW